LQKAKAISLIELTARQKMHPELARIQEQKGSKAFDQPAEMQITFPRSFRASEVLEYLKSRNITVTNTELIQFSVSESNNNQPDQRAQFNASSGICGACTSPGSIAE
jgi:hypothetical protein